MWVLWSLLSVASSRRSSVSKRSDEPAVDEVATKAVISVLSGYAGKYLKGKDLRHSLRNKCCSCLLRRNNGSSDNGVFANMELGIESIEKLIDNPGTIKELKMKSLRISIGFLTITIACNSSIDASSLLPIPRHWWRIMLYTAGRLDEAKKVISNLWGSSEVDKSIEEFQSVLKNDGDDLDSRWSEILEELHSKVVVAFIGDALFVLQHFAGINEVLYFSSLTFKDAGISNGALASLYVGLTNFAGALYALYFVDRQGSERLIIGSYLGMEHVDPGNEQQRLNT
ncbi:hypothetical protein L2E82_44313 [Cichorium intybus]|uniref:Uncharacterized protein n=1 Tax=Cichorium intybus TaxID=13427 RepID=A0ACB8ZPM9_CICIN|nr:hypothetical protein L2E82_44313 [Cichorium intybus]